ncbi:hypothetical protein C8Q74DRAFT_1359666 [Fomes fomentarius]|nr:hypothetical protein C8Q74DRAFT_1359666 [Fomes fomentarius]
MSTLPRYDIPFRSTFPPEIKDLIIDQLHGDVETLRQCALTCSGWLRRSRYNLYFSVRVERREQLFSLCSAITQYTHLRPLVRSVTLAPERLRSADEQYLLEIVPIPLLTLLPNLRHWSLHGRRFRKAKKTMEVTANMEGHGPQEGAIGDTEHIYSPLPCDRMSLACLQRHSTTIRELYLGDVCFPTSMDCARLVLSFSALRSLQCDGISVETSQMIPDAWMIRVAGRVHIRSLSLFAILVAERPTAQHTLHTKFSKNIWEVTSRSRLECPTELIGRHG